MSTSSKSNRKWLALALLATAQFMVVLDASIVNVALPSVGSDLGLDQASLAWVVNAYVLVFGGFLLLGGRMADLLGRRRLFMGGLILFAVASLLAGLSTSEAQLIATRALQGLGAAIVSPAALSIVTTTFREGAERNRALGVWGAIAGAGGAAGVLLGGVLTESLGWEWVFFVNAPVGLAAAALAPMLVDESRMDRAGQTFDALGAISVTAGLSVLVYALLDAESAGWGSTQTIGLLAGAAVLLATFAVIEMRSKSPLVPFSIFRLRNLSGANVVGLLVGAALFSMFFFVSIYMQRVLGFGALEAGLAYLPLAITIIISAGAASQLITRLGFKRVLTAGLVLVAAGLLWFAQVSAGGSYVADVLGPSLLAGAGLGFSFVPVTVAAVSGVQGKEAGLASGLINTSQQIGGALGLAVLASIATTTTNNLLPELGTGPDAMATALAEGFQTAFYVGAGFAVLGLIATVFIIRGGDGAETPRVVESGDAPRVDAAPATGGPEPEPAPAPESAPEREPEPEPARA